MALTLLTSFPEVDVRDLLLLARAEEAAGRFDLAAALGERAVPLVPATKQEALLAQIQTWRARLN